MSSSKITTIDTKRVGVTFTPVSKGSTSGLHVWFAEDITNVLAAVAIARSNLSEGEREVLDAVAAGFGLVTSWRL